MVSKQNLIVGLDIGTTSITVVVCERLAGSNGSSELNVIGVGSAPSRGIRKGVVINIEATVASIEAAVMQAEAMAGCEIEEVYAAVSGSHIKSLNSHGIVGIKNREVSQDDIARVIEAAKAVAIPIDRDVLHVLPQEFVIDEQDGIREPLGIAGVRLEARVHIVTGATASAQNIVKCANRCGLSVRDLVLSGLASGRAVLTPEEQELGVCMIDIGGGTTDVAVFHNCGVKHSAVLSVGGNHITNDIAAGLRTPLISAEQIKAAQGTALVSLVGSSEVVEVPSTGGREPRILSKLVLAEIIEPRVTEIFTLVQRELVRSGCEELLTSGIVLCGGGANMTGIAQLAEQVFNLPVRVGSPRNVSGLKDLVHPPEYATAVGLVLHGAYESARDPRSNSRFWLRRTARKVGNWFGEYF